MRLNKFNLINNIYINYIIKQLMHKGKKYLINKNILNIYNTNININNLVANIKLNLPYVQLVNIKLGTNLYKIPVEIKKYRQLFIYTKWFKIYLKKNKINLSNNLLKLFIDIINNKTPILKDKYNLHKESLANRLYMNYRW